MTQHMARVLSLKAFKGRNVILPKSISYILTPSKYLEPVLADGYMIEYPNDKMISIGFPLHDVLYKTEPGDLKKLTSEKYKKILLWMPTFRKNVDGREDSSRVQTLGIPIINSYEEYNRLNLTLAKEEVLLIISNSSYARYERYQSIIIIKYLFIGWKYCQKTKNR